jgi:hypothetical protein
MTGSMTMKALVVTLSAIIKRAWRVMSAAERWGNKIEYSRFYVQSLWTLCKRIEGAALALEAWGDSTARRLGILDEVLDRCAA